jgi:hypothetical protein
MRLNSGLLVRTRGQTTQLFLAAMEQGGKLRAGAAEATWSTVALKRGHEEVLAFLTGEQRQLLDEVGLLLSEASAGDGSLR